VKKIIEKIKNKKSLKDILGMIDFDSLLKIANRFPDLKSHLEYLSKGSVTIKTDPPYYKNVKFNFKIVDYEEDIEDDGQFIGTDLYIDLLLPNQLTSEEKQFVSEWVTSYVQEDPKDIDTPDVYFNDKTVWIKIIKINGVIVEIGFVDNTDPPSDEKLFDILNIPYRDENID
jgi:hypothetical protein